MTNYKKEYIDIMEERIRRELVADMICLVRTLNNAIEDVEQGIAVNTMGVVQNAGRNIDMNCYALAHIKEVKTILE